MHIWVYYNLIWFNILLKYLVSILRCILFCISNQSVFCSNWSSALEGESEGHDALHQYLLLLLFLCCLETQGHWKMTILEDLGQLFVWVQIFFEYHLAVGGMFHWFGSLFATCFGKNRSNFRNQGEVQKLMDFQLEDRLQEILKISVFFYNSERTGNTPRWKNQHPGFFSPLILGLVETFNQRKPTGEKWGTIFNVLLFTTVGYLFWNPIMAACEGMLSFFRRILPCLGKNTTWAPNM